MTVIRPVTRPVVSPIIRSVTERGVGGAPNYLELTIPAAKQAGAVSKGVYPIKLPDLPLANDTASDVCIRDASGNTIPHNLVAKSHIASIDGIWSFYGGPTAIYDPDAGTSGRMFVGFMDFEGARNISQFDVASKQWTQATVSDDATNQVDDHNHPGLAINNDGKLVYACCQHNTGNMFVRVANTAGTIADGFAAAVEVGNSTLTSYSWLFNLADVGDNGTLFLFSRRYVNGNTDLAWWMSKSTDKGAAWSDYVKVLETDTVNNYNQMWSNDSDTIWIAMNETESNGSRKNRGIYCFKFDGTSFKNVDGTTIGEAVTETADIGSSSVIFAHAGSGRRSVSDVMVGADGHPRVLYYEYTDEDEDEHVLCHARWIGTEWITNTVVDEGDPWAPSPSNSYPGVGRFNRSNINELATTVTVGTQREVQIYLTSSNGASWSKSKDVTSGSLRHNFRPVYAHALTTEVAAIRKVPHLFWCGNGRYEAFTDYLTTIKAYPADYAHAALAKLDIDGESDATFRVHWRDTRNESATILDDLGVQYAHFGVGKFNDNRESLSGYSTNHPTAQFGTSNKLYVDDAKTFPSLKITQSDNERVFVDFNYRNAAAVSLVWFGLQGGTGRQHLIANNVGAGPNAMLRRTSTDKPEFLVYQTSAYSTKTATAAFPNDECLIVGVFDRSAENRMKVRINTIEETGTASDQNINDAKDSEPSAIGATKGGLPVSEKLNGTFSFAMIGTVALSKAYTDTLYAALSDPDTFAVASE